MTTPKTMNNKCIFKISLRLISLKALFSIYLLLFVGVHNLMAQIIIDSNNVVNAEAGIYINVEGHWQNNGLFMSDSASYVKLSGGQQEISGTQVTRFANLIIEGQGNKELNNILQQYAEVSKSLVFNAQKIEINNNDLILLSDAAIINASNQRYVVTAGTGRLIKKEVPNNVDFLFPIGTTTGSYTPVTLNYSGMLDTFAVRVFDGVNPPDQTAVQKTFLIKAAHPSNTTADISLAWNTADEGSLFIPAQTLMWQQQASVWNMINNPVGASSNIPQTDWQYKADNVQFLSNSTDSFILKSSAPPDILSHPRDVAVCETETAIFSITATAFGAITYQWQINCAGTWSDVNNGGFAPNYSGNNDSVLVIGNAPFALNGCIFRCIINTLAGQTISDPAKLTVYSQPIVYINGDSLFCEGQNGILEALGNASGYIWNTGDTTQSINVFPLPASQTYSVTVTNDYFCENTAQKTVYVTPDFDVNLTSNFDIDQTIYVGQQIIITAHSPGYDNYNFFMNNNLIQSGGSNICTISSLTTDIYVHVTAFINNCEANDSLLVKVKPIPNAFTPFDKNSKNDVFAKGIDLTILNRWGQILFIGDEGWDGTYNGSPVSPGTYFYIMNFKNNIKDSFSVKGSVLIVKAKQ